jgi:FtsP/CotA-like multicopper oxidase with cupredoxin domain
MTMMSHPLHLHGHTFALADSGLRKDTVILRPMESRAIELQADNLGDWMIHCHNIYHAEAGMMIELNYQT